MKKKILLSGLILFMVFGSVGLVSCGGDDNNNNNNNNQTKVVAAEYRGEFWAEGPSGLSNYSKAIISENEILVTVEYVSEDTDITTLDSNFLIRETVWTEELEEYTRLKNTNERVIGSFPDKNTLSLNIGATIYDNYTRK